MPRNMDKKERQRLIFYLVGLHNQPHFDFRYSKKKKKKNTHTHTDTPNNSISSQT